MFPEIFRGAFDWNYQYLHGQKKHFSFYLNLLDRHYEVETFKMANDQWVSLFNDVSAQSKKIIRLEESKHLYQVLLEAVPDLFFIIDKDGTYVDFVFKATEALKIKPEDIIANSIFEVEFSEKMSSKIYACIQPSGNALIPIQLNPLNPLKPCYPCSFFFPSGLTLLFFPTFQPPKTYWFICCLCIN